MSERRVRGSAQIPKTRVRNNHNDPRNVSFQTDDADVETVHNKLRAAIYVPPPLEKGMVGRDGVVDYNPYSPAQLENKIRYWPQPNSNHHATIENQASIDSSKRYKRNTTVRKSTQQIDAPERVDKSKRPVSRRPRGGGLRYSESSEDERHHTEYREIQDDAPSPTYLQSQSSGYESYIQTNDTNNFSMVESVDQDQSCKRDNNCRFGYLSKSESIAGTFETNDGTIKGVDSDAEDSFFFRTPQTPAVCTIALTSIQLLMLMLQLAMCGIATLEVNPTIGPFPDAFSQWGGKNPYLTLHENQWWRLVTPAFLHVGILHLIVNVYCQVHAAAMFEREWGWFSWLFLYICSEIGCSTFSNLFDPDSVAVGSTGAMMGLFAAKLAQVVTFGLFETKPEYQDAIHLHQLSTILCGLTLESLMGALTYIDFSGNLGGLISGFFGGIIVFSSCIKGCCFRFWWMVIGFAGLASTFFFTLYFFIETAEPNEQLANVCEYFRSFFPEEYECGCLWN